ncbi:MAG: DUF3592 domain-containing protein [Clostridia bacterium]|nr:DUF3592 domain-containing protein [Clostridia bacterium]
MKKLYKRVEFWVMFAVLAIGVTLVVNATVHTVTVSRQLAEYTHIQATVNETVIVAGNGSSPSTVASVVEFEVDGKIYTIKNRVSSTSNTDKAGSKVEIAYNPNDPNDCLFVESEKTWCVLFCAFSGMFLTFGTAFAVLLIKSMIRESRGRTL